MRWLKRLAIVLLVGLMLVAVLVGLVYLTNPRSERAFSEDTDGRVTLAQGEAACDWLRDQRPALFDLSTPVANGALARRYAESDGDQKAAREAWQHLCGATYDLMVLTHSWEILFGDGA